MSLIFQKLIYCYIGPVLSLIGFVLNTSCFIIFTDAKFKSSNVYNYLKVEILFIDIDLILNSMRPIYFCDGSITANRYSSLVFAITSQYFGIIAQMTALICEILSNVEFYLQINNLKKSKFNFKLPSLPNLSYSAHALLF